MKRYTLFTTYLYFSNISFLRHECIHVIKWALSVTRPTERSINFHAQGPSLFHSAERSLGFTWTVLQTYGAEFTTFTKKSNHRLVKCVRFFIKSSWLLSFCYFAEEFLRFQKNDLSSDKNSYNQSRLSVVIATTVCCYTKKAVAACVTQPRSKAFSHNIGKSTGDEVVCNINAREFDSRYVHSVVIFIIGRT